ncbi:hypothetical protein BOTBODRAFT_179613 [Botryobasidium botryosum FD-172 SS1]|uniref:Protein kinase domain-containing protein n=1 Tax=Botryobasidium botryosum (strain FD-172 SS1) TaxID=930990 RepID=A0A067LZ31_BOTB1|nr:hypothetical protein BOTBODRAFT_179613 [Botryobasidium botryosum FD-172 SS1]
MSPFMQNGTADDFVKKNPNVNRVRMLVQIPQGLEYMHTQNSPIIHGDLKANNILVSEDGSACLSDFGLSRIHVKANAAAIPETGDTFAPAPITVAYLANFRWGASEVLLDGARRTLASDIYSFGRPKVEKCWDREPLKRPSASHVVERLQRLPEPASVDPGWGPWERAPGSSSSGDSSSRMSIPSGATNSMVDSKPMDLD